MDHVHGQPQAEVHGIAEPNGKDAVSRTPPSDCSLPIPYLGSERLSIVASEKCVDIQPGIYTKYAGDPPDGGLKAWSVILATSLMNWAAFGFVTSWGVFQAYYEEVLLPNNSPSEIAWIGSVQTVLIFFPGLVVGRLFDIGYLKIPCFLASCLLISCAFLVAECKVYWQFLLVQGFGVGVASGFLFGPTLAIVPHWFSKRKGLAVGLSVVGTSVGGIVFPIAARNLLPEVGFVWTMRIFGFMLLALLSAANLMIDRRLPPVNFKGGLFNWAALKNPTYAVYCIAGITAFLGMYTVLTYISVSAAKVGVSKDFAFYLVAIANVTSIVGRILAGFIADKAGALNVMIPFTILVAIMTVTWPYVTSQGGLIAVAMAYGFGYGTYMSLVCVPVIAMGSTGDVGRRMGLFLSFLGLGALAGTPISGLINSATGGFVFVGWYAGGILLVSAFLQLLSRYLHLGRMLGKF